MKTLSTMVLLFAMYVAAVPLTSKVSMQLSLTDWSNVWTYFFILFSLPIWITLVLLSAAIGLGILFLIERIME